MRYIEPYIREDLARKMVFVGGPSQVGKTTLLKKIAEDLKSKYLFVSGEDISIQDYLSSQSIEKLRNFIGQNKVLIIDEAQKIKNIGINIKLILDTKEQLSVNIPILNGLYVSELNNINKDKFRINKELKGILINDIVSQSRAEKIGFENGDVIVQIEDIETTNLQNLQKALKQYNNKQKRIYINRYGQLFIVLVK